MRNPYTRTPPTYAVLLRLSETMDGPDFELIKTADGADDMEGWWKRPGDWIVWIDRVEKA